VFAQLHASKQKFEQICALVINLLLCYLCHSKRRYLRGSCKSYELMLEICAIVIFKMISKSKSIHEKHVVEETPNPNNRSIYKGRYFTTLFLPFGGQHRSYSHMSHRNIQPVDLHIDQLYKAEFQILVYSPLFQLLAILQGSVHRTILFKKYILC